MGGIGPEQPKPLTLDMIKPTPDNTIPPNGIYPLINPEGGALYTNYSKNPLDDKARRKFLKYIASSGMVSAIPTYNEIKRGLTLTPEQTLEELETLADLYMNAAEAARRRNEHFKSQGKSAIENPLKLLEKSIEYQKQARELEEKIK
jgi:hypothetical protein